MSTGDLPPRPDFLSCRYCTDSRGKPKVTFPSEHEAGMALVDAKLKAVFKHNQRRREQRKYECPVHPGWWHLSSVDEAEVEIRKAEQARRKQLRPYLQALEPLLSDTDLAGRVDELAGLLCDNGWTAPRRSLQQRAA